MDFSRSGRVRGPPSVVRREERRARALLGARLRRARRRRAASGRVPAVPPPSGTRRDRFRSFLRRRRRPLFVRGRSLLWRRRAGVALVRTRRIIVAASACGRRPLFVRGMRRWRRPLFVRRKGEPERRRYEVILNPGDLLYVPSWWWHQIENEPGFNAAVALRGPRSVVRAFRPAREFSPKRRRGLRVHEANFRDVWSPPDEVFGTASTRPILVTSGRRRPGSAPARPRSSRRSATSSTSSSSRSV